MEVELWVLFLLGLLVCVWILFFGGAERLSNSVFGWTSLRIGKLPPWSFRLGSWLALLAAGFVLVASLLFPESRRDWLEFWVNLF